ncbi:MAG: hypothetical protein ACQEST_10125 [Bacteroidota bacterium]
MPKTTSHSILFVAVLLVVSVGISSCSDDNDETVNQEYLESEEYSSFKEDAQRESDKRSEEPETLSEDLQRLSDCSSVATLSLPFSTDGDDLEERSEEISDDCRLENGVRTISLLGNYPLGEINLQLVLLEHQTVYRDDELIAVTFAGNELRSFQTVAIYQKNPAREISTQLSMQQGDNGIQINTETTRNIQYPIDQNNTIETVYEVDTKGGIHEL